ncbi:MAG: transcription elongation factor GreA [Dehalococcoidia bacterium]|nr:transcription elongation factor GreA [Dehalococcoidia bacterium]MDD5647572.1 transcription elongation factor GreA [Dehalococcoidia bacterium]
MPSKQKPLPVNPGTSLGEAATRFLSTVSTESAPKIQQELLKFTRWYGLDRPIIDLTGQVVSSYSEQFHSGTSQTIEHLNAVKTFLSYCFKQGLTASNLAPHIRVKKPTTSQRTSINTVKIEEPIILTKDGYEELKRKLAVLKEERPKISEELRRAAADKDFRENAPLEAAREKQGHVEGQIRDLENTLKRARVIESPEEKGLKITMGDTVVISFVESGERIQYTLVSSQEANIQQGKISLNSPMGQALFNREAGDALEVTAPSGVLKYQIIEILRK